jgi:hypothetical protein
MAENIIKLKSFSFALQIVKLCQFLSSEFQSLNLDIIEINKILASIIISTKNNLKR